MRGIIGCRRIRYWCRRGDCRAEVHVTFPQTFKCIDVLSFVSELLGSLATITCGCFNVHCGAKGCKGISRKVRLGQAIISAIMHLIDIVQVGMFFSPNQGVSIVTVCKPGYALSLLVSPSAAVGAEASFITYGKLCERLRLVSVGGMRVCGCGLLPYRLHPPSSYL